MWFNDTKKGLLFCRQGDFRYTENVCVMSLYDCVIKVKIGLTGRKTMEPFSSSVFPFLKDVHDRGGSIIFLENQGSKPIYFIKSSIADFIKMMNMNNSLVPFIFIVSTKKNMYKKPQTNIFKAIKNEYKILDKNIDLENSIYIGANAGRTGNELRCRDASVVDRALCHNIGIPCFRTPEQVFLGDETPYEWHWNSSMPSRRDVLHMVNQGSIEEENTLFNSFTGPRMAILLNGPHSSGKSLLGNHIKRHLGRGDIKETSSKERGEFYKNYNEKEVIKSLKSHEYIRFNIKIRYSKEILYRY
jgi:DNA 3'-phosphatase